MAGGREQPSTVIGGEELAEGTTAPAPAVHHEAQAMDTCSKHEADAGAMGKKVAKDLLGGEEGV